MTGEIAEVLVNLFVTIAMFGLSACPMLCLIWTSLLIGYLLRGRQSPFVHVVFPDTFETNYNQTMHHVHDFKINGEDGEDVEEDDGDEEDEESGEEEGPVH